ncbi:MAG: hypothetical protein AB8B69_22870 [Chitinophagales bacterium]
MDKYLKSGLIKVEIIRSLVLSIYDKIEVGDEKLWLTSQELQAVLDNHLSGLDLSGLPLRTRSKKVKLAICVALGYSIPKSFKKTQPRFIGQKFDTYTQKSNNLQVWNEDLDLSRRYVLIQLNEDDVVTKVKVVAGSDLAPLDTTGKLTQKYQARLSHIEDECELVSEIDTNQVGELCSEKMNIQLSDSSPIDIPIKGDVLSIKVLFEKLQPIIGQGFEDPGSVQERNRGAELHKLICQALGFSEYKDNGQFPDIRHQLLEVKLQTSTTIDLGLVTPNSQMPLDMEKIEGISVRHCDVRYAVFCGKIENGFVEITNLIVTTGKDFFGRFPQFEGKGLNKKIQIRLPKDFFEA